MSASSLPEVRTTIEVAALLQCEPEKVEDRTRRRELPAVKFGRSWMHPREALMQVLNRIALHIEPASGARLLPAVTPMRMAAPPAPRSSRGLRRSPPPPQPDPPSQAGLSRVR